MRKADIVSRIHQQAEISEEQAAQLLEWIVALLKCALEQGESIVISGFGTFRVRSRSPRKGRNPRTGEGVMIPAHRVVTFHASPIFKAEVNAAGQTSTEQWHQISRAERAAAEGEVVGGGVIGGKVMTNEELTTAINDAIYNFSDSLRGLVKEAARRLDQGGADDALRQSFRYAVRIVTYIQNEKPKRNWEHYCHRCQQSHLAPIWYHREGQGDREHGQEWMCGNQYGESSIHEKNLWILWEPPRESKT